MWDVCLDLFLVFCFCFWESSVFLKLLGGLEDSELLGVDLFDVGLLRDWVLCLEWFVVLEDFDDWCDWELVGWVFEDCCGEGGVIEDEG